jgi:hypothetical protein
MEATVALTVTSGGNRIYGDPALLVVGWILTFISWRRDTAERQDKRRYANASAWFF